MCMVEDSDGNVDLILDEVIRKARISHKCAECYRTINVSEKYGVTVYKWDGDLINHKICLHCRVARSWLNKECRGFIYSAVQEDIFEHVYSRNYGMPLARMAVSMKRKWTKKNGELMPIPVCPPTTFERKSQA